MLQEGKRWGTEKITGNAKETQASAPRPANPRPMGQTCFQMWKEGQTIWMIQTADSAESYRLLFEFENTAVCSYLFVPCCCAQRRTGPLACRAAWCGAGWRWSPRGHRHDCNTQQTNHQQQKIQPLHPDSFNRSPFRLCKSQWLRCRPPLSSVVLTRCDRLLHPALLALIPSHLP